MSTQSDSTPAATAEAPDKGVGCDALLALLRSGPRGDYDGYKSAQLMQQAADTIEALQKYWREEREKSVACEALNLLCVMRPIDWVFVFSAPMNGGHNAARIAEAVERLEAAFGRANIAGQRRPGGSAEGRSL